MGPQSHPKAGETLEDSGAGPDAVLPVRPYLFLVLEADRPSAGGARYALADVDEVAIGRGDARSVRRTAKSGGERVSIRVPGRWMSSAHARILRVRGTFVIEDAGSRNGTYVGGERVTRQTLSDGDVIEAGHSFFVFRSGLPTPAGVARDLDQDALRALSPGLRTLLPSLAPRYEELTRVARSEVPILLLGETGTGKEVLARATHEISERRGAFVAVNCGSLSPALVEGLLFGHVKGSFSGATRDELGFLRAAEGGTLFLDEIGDFPASAQPALLRVLQEREVVPVGTSRPVPVRFRVVAATHRDLDDLVASGAFRRDLLMRLDGFRQLLTPLRERMEDTGVLVAELLARRSDAAAATFTTAAASALLEGEWVGNVRELDQVLARAIALTKDGAIDAAHLALPVRPAPSLAEEARALSAADEKLRADLVLALERHGGNVSDVARDLGKARMQVQRWMRRFAIDPEKYRGAR
jgi:transcriptional regulator with AAA-type ATPase domain